MFEEQSQELEHEREQVLWLLTKLALPVAVIMITFRSK